MWGVWGGLPPRMTKALEIDEPPELYYVMRSICDHLKPWDEQTKIINLAKNARTKIFYDDYPLNENINRETFEIDILNHFLYRRIGFDTVTGFRIALVNKLREIMPKYNLMFDLMFKDIFSDTYTEEFSSRKDNEGGFVNQNNGGYENNITRTETQNQSESKSGNSTENTTTSTTEDLRNSDTPQNRLSDVRAGEYVSEYNYNQRNGTESKTKNFTETGTKNTTTTGTEKDTNKHNDTDTNHHVDTDTFLHEKKTTNTANLLDKYGLLQEYRSIMGMIYHDLDCLFLQVFDY